jgi:hypothetical protein
MIALTLLQTCSEMTCRAGTADNAPWIVTESRLAAEYCNSGDAA